MRDRNPSISPKDKMIEYRGFIDFVVTVKNKPTDNEMLADAVNELKAVPAYATIIGFAEPEAPFFWFRDKNTDVHLRYKFIM